MTISGGNSSDYVIMNKNVPRWHCSSESCGGALDSQEGINSDTLQPMCQLTTRRCLRRSPHSQNKTTMDNSYPELVMDCDNNREEHSARGNSPGGPTLTYTTPGQQQTTLGLPPLARAGPETSRRRSSTPHPQGSQKPRGSPAAALAARAQQRVTLVDTCTKCHTIFFSKELPSAVGLAPKLCAMCRMMPACPQCSSTQVDYTSSLIHKDGFTTPDSCSLPQSRLISVTWCNNKHCSWPMNSPEGPYQYEQLVTKL